MKRLTLLLAAVLLLTALAACSGSSPTPKIESLDDLDGKKIGVQLGTTGHIYAAEEYGDDSVELFNKGVEAVMALKNGQVDAVIIDNEPAKVFVSQNDDLTILNEPFEDEFYAICIAKENTALLEAFNGAIAELKANGTLQQILDSYINDPDNTPRYRSPEGVDRSNGTVTMATNAEFPPYEYHESGQIIGVDPDLARAICDLLGYTLVIEDMEFNSIIAAVQSGMADFGAAGMTVRPDRQESVNFTDTYVQATQVVIVKK
ncbi:MAG: transporter substrate-binding domain-containing protein [Oscillospiraceae bacterium]|nr:transporter substrate-binding domain-containing protein [Oscillospiraceae bacterium]